ncbi:hypothetical protein acdb102_45180 [Acidothermaceae bacterium B102]|nr:hypothetical protein acdb102_45180 [Acidothermaceae bacterium B102]
MSALSDPASALDHHPLEERMTTLTSEHPAVSESRRPKTRLGFNTRVSFSEVSGGPAQGLRDGIELFRVAEELGYQGGWAYQRHFDNYLSSPIPFFAAVGQHTDRITLGSAVIPMRYQDPILLAEAAGTADLLTGGRLQLAVSSGTEIWTDVFGAVDTDARTEGQRRLARFLAGVSGESIHTVTTQRPPGGPPVGTELRVTPHSPGLRDRIWYGSGHIASAVNAARQGLRLVTGTILQEVTDESFAEYQARLIGEYRAAWVSAHGTPPPPRRGRGVGAAGDDDGAEGEVRGVRPGAAHLGSGGVSAQGGVGADADCGVAAGGADESRLPR